MSLLNEDGFVFMHCGLCINYSEFTHENLKLKPGLYSAIKYVILNSYPHKGNMYMYLKVAWSVDDLASYIMAVHSIDKACVSIVVQLTPCVGTTIVGGQCSSLGDQPELL